MGLLISSLHFAKKKLRIMVAIAVESLCFSSWSAKAQKEKWFLMQSNEIKCIVWTCNNISSNAVFDINFF